MADVRAKLDDLGSELGRTYEISIASPVDSTRLLTSILLVWPFSRFLQRHDLRLPWYMGRYNRSPSSFYRRPAGYDIETAVEAY